MSDLKSQLMKAREFDEDAVKCAGIEERSATDIDDAGEQMSFRIGHLRGSKFMYAKDQRLFELLCDVAVATEAYVNIDSIVNVVKRAEDQKNALAALKSFVAGEK